MSLSSLRYKWPVIAYITLAIIAVASILFIMLFSPQARVNHTVAQEETRRGYLFAEELPESMATQWEAEGFDDIISAPGTIIGIKHDSVQRLDKDTGEVIWEYHRPGGSICDAKQAWGDVAVVYDMGKGCSDLTRLDAATGQYVAQASYATDQDVLKMVYADEKLALVTPHAVRVVRGDLVPMTQFGQHVDYHNATDFSNCDIYDATISPKALVVSHQCNGSNTTHITAVEINPEESSQPAVITDVDTHHPDPVTTPVATLAQMKFVTQGVEPIDYTWQLDKDLAEVSAHPVRQGEYGLWGDSFDGIGYVWTIGTNMYVRYGSEDVSQFTHHFQGAMTNPVEANGKILVGTENGFSFWNTQDGSRHDIAVDKDISQNRKIAFAGDTIATFNDGIITAFA